MILRFISFGIIKFIFENDEISFYRIEKCQKIEPVFGFILFALILMCPLFLLFPLPKRDLTHSTMKNFSIYLIKETLSQLLCTALQESSPSIFPLN